MGEACTAPLDCKVFGEGTVIYYVSVQHLAQWVPSLVVIFRRYYSINVMEQDMSWG